MSSKDSEFEERSREHLRAAVDNIDARVRSKLTQARFAAVEEARKARAGRPARLWLPAGAVAATAVLAVFLWSTRPLMQPASVAMPGESLSGADPTAIDDLELLSATESFELLEDLEFYDWVETAVHAGDGDVS